MRMCHICDHPIKNGALVGRYEGKDVHVECQLAMLAWVGVYEMAATSPYNRKDVLEKGEKVSLGNEEFLSRDSYGLYIYHYKSRMIPGWIGQKYVPLDYAQKLYKDRK